MCFQGPRTLGVQHLETTWHKGGSETVTVCVGDPLGFAAGGKIRVSALGSIPSQQISEPRLSNLIVAPGPLTTNRTFHVLKAHQGIPRHQPPGLPVPMAGEIDKEGANRPQPRKQNQDLALPAKTITMQCHWDGARNRHAPRSLTESEHFRVPGTSLCDQWALKNL